MRDHLKTTYNKITHKDSQVARKISCGSAGITAEKRKISDLGGFVVADDHREGARQDLSTECIILKLGY